MQEKVVMVQVGTAALRAPDGSFLPAVPLYIKDEDANAINPHTGNKAKEDYYIQDISQDLAAMYKKYIDGVKKAGLKS